MENPKTDKNQIAILHQKITPFFWFDNQAEEAANFYVSIFQNSGIDTITRYTAESAEPGGMKEGMVMTVVFHLEGQEFTALNGGPIYKVGPGISFVISCKDQQEIDYYWDKLTEGGPLEAQQCGWLQDKFGLSWQVVPAELGKLLGGNDKARTARVSKALLQMKKLDVNVLREAYNKG